MPLLVQFKYFLLILSVFCEENPLLAERKQIESSSRLALGPPSFLSNGHRG
jgi:hypothetical protein